MRRARAFAGRIAIALALAGLAACGFQPLYGDNSVTQGLTHIQVVAPQGRLGYLLRQDLDDALGKDVGDAPSYRLEMVLGQTQTGHGLTANDTAQRYELDLKVTYTLTDLATGKVAHTGQVVSMMSYDSADQPYAGIAARQDTQNRLAADAAQKIEIQIAAFLSRQDAG